MWWHTPMSRSSPCLLSLTLTFLHCRICCSLRIRQDFNATLPGITTQASDFMYHRAHWVQNFLRRCGRREAALAKP